MAWASYTPAGQFFCEANYLDSTSKTIVEFSKNGSEMQQKSVGQGYKIEFDYKLAAQPYDDIFIYFRPDNGARPLITFKFKWDGKSAETQELNMLTQMSPYLGACEKI